MHLNALLQFAVFTDSPIGEYRSLSLTWNLASYVV